MGRVVRVEESIEIARPPETVFDFTQDWARRREWDRSIVAAEIVAAGPPPLVRVKAAGGVRALFRYRGFSRGGAAGFATSLAMEEVASWLIAGGGGAWSYAATPVGTRFTQVNTLELKPGALRSLLAPLVLAQLRASTRAALAKAKRLLEAAPR